MPLQPPDLAPFGFFFELFPFLLRGGKPVAADQAELDDVLSHIQSAKSHLAAGAAGKDPYNALVGRLDADTNLALGWAVASRIGDRELRKKAFAALATVGFGPLGL